MANNAVRPKVRDQIHDRALSIIDPFYKIPEGYTDAGIPVFQGLPLDVWMAIHDKKPKQFAELIDILRSDFPTYAALCLKVFAKKVGHLVPFFFNLGQVIAWNKMAGRIAAGETLFIAFLKARQLGISTLVGGFQHWQVWRLTDIDCNMVGHEKPLVYAFIDRLRIFHEELPKVPGIQRELRSNAAKARVPKDELYYSDNRSKITTVVAKSVEPRGRSAMHNLLSEYAFYDDAATLLSALMPQLPPVGSEARKQCSVIIETTPNGKNDFYKLWQLAKQGNSEWLAVFLPWFVLEDEYSLPVPRGWKMSAEQTATAKRLSHIRKFIDGRGYITPAQMHWYEQTLLTEAEGDQDRMDKEYPSDDETCFLLQSRSIFKHEMRYLQATVVEAERSAPGEFRKRDLECKGKFVRGELNFPRFSNPFGTTMPSLKDLRLRPEFKPTPRGELIVWSPPQVNHTYVIGMDSAAGIMDRDLSVACVVDVDTGRQVAELAGCISPEDFGDLGVALGWWYNCGVLYPEINSIGVVTMKRIKQVWQYPQLGREEKWDEIGVKPNKYGHYTSAANKSIMVSFVKYLVDNHFIGIASEALLSEMSIFVQTGDDDFEADNNGHDDRVIALCLACMVIRQSPKLMSRMNLERKEPGIPATFDVMMNDSPAPRTEHPGLPKELREQLPEFNLAVPANPIRGELDMVMEF